MSRQLDAGPHRPLRTGVGSVLALVGLSALGWALAWQANSGDSDGATVVLEGQAMAHGNLLLAGWQQTYDGFWTIDAPFYAVATLAVGVRPLQMYLVPAVIVALCVLVGSALSSSGRSAGGARVGAVVVAAALALPSHTTAYFLLRGPIHIATALFAVTAFALLRRGRFGARWVLAVVLLAAGLLGDLQMVALGVVPVAVGGVLGAIRERRLGAAVSPVLAAVASVMLALAVRGVALAIGTFRFSPGTDAGTSVQQHENVHLLVQASLRVLGFSAAVFGRGGVPAWLQHVHLAVAALLAVCAAVVLVRLVVGLLTGPGYADDRRGLAGAMRSEESAWRLDDMLLVSLASVPVIFVYLANSSDPTFARYLTAGLVIGAVLAGRVCARCFDRTSWRSLRATGTVAGIAVTALLAVGVAFSLSSTPVAKPAVGLARWLEVHRLDSGLGDYFSASVTTVDSADRVRVRPVIVNSSGRLVSYHEGPLDAWYAGRRFRFLVFSRPSGFGGVDRRAGERTWGAPASIHDVGPYVVMVWDRPLRVAVRS